MKDNYTYAVVEKEEDGIVYLYAPAFSDVFCAVEDDEDRIKSIQEALAMKLIDLIDTKEHIPDDVKAEAGNGEKLYYVSVWLPYYRSLIKETYTKKTLTIPTWLDILAKSKNVNFSAILVKGLKEELNIQ